MIRNFYLICVSKIVDYLKNEKVLSVLFLDDILQPFDNYLSLHMDRIYHQLRQIY